MRIPMRCFAGAFFSGIARAFAAPLQKQELATGPSRTQAGRAKLEIASRSTPT